MTAALDEFFSTISRLIQYYSVDNNEINEAYFICKWEQNIAGNLTNSLILVNQHESSVIQTVVSLETYFIYILNAVGYKSTIILNKLRQSVKLIE